MSTSVSSRTGGGAHDGADALGGAAAATDHATEIAGPDAHVEAHAATALGAVDLDGGGIVDEGRDDVSEHGSGRGRPDAVAGVVVAHVALLAAPNCSRAPEISSSLRTRSVGWAPCCSHFTALSLSTVSDDGSVRGL